MGPDEAIMGAFIDGAYFRPKKKKVIFIVIPKIDNNIKLNQSVFFIHKDLAANGKRRHEAEKNRKKAKVKGVMF